MIPWNVLPWEPGNGETLVLAHLSLEPQGLSEIYIYIIHSGTANRMGEVGVEGYRFGHCLILFRTILIFMHSVYLSPDWNK